MCATIAKRIKRDDLRALSYRHLSFSLRGCGQNNQADEAYRRAMKYETRAAPNSPIIDGDHNKNKGKTMSMETSTTTTTTADAVTSFVDDLDNNSPHLPELSSSFLSVTSKSPMQHYQRHQHEYLTSEEYEQGLQALAEANALLRDEVETLKRQSIQDNTVKDQINIQLKEETNEAEDLKRELVKEEERCNLLEKNLKNIQNNQLNLEQNYVNEKKTYENRINALNMKILENNTNMIQKDETIVLLNAKVQELNENIAKTSEKMMKMTNDMSTLDVKYKNINDDNHQIN